MLAHQRQQRILNRVLSDGAVTVAELGSALSVSDMTIRRDVNELVAQGLVERVHGGITAPSSASAFEPGFTVKSEQGRDAKTAIARAAVRYIRPGTTIGISGGTTTHALAREMLRIPDITVVTNSLPVADVLHADGRADRTVLLTGGQRTPSYALVGPVAVGTLQTLHVDLLFLGTHGVDIDAGLTCPNLLEAQTNQAFVTSARRVVVLADHTKWGVRALATTVGLSAVDVIVTDIAVPERIRDELPDIVDDVVVAAESRPSTQEANRR